MTKLRLAWLPMSVLVLWAGAVGAEDIWGTVDTTITILEDSRLVGDVTCTMTNGPCIEFGASDISLRLNGFKLTGPADPEGGACNATSGNPPADGIRVFEQTGARILGPGIVQKFRRHGISAFGIIDVSTSLTVKQVTSHHNCFSGLLMVRVSDSVVQGVVSVRNAGNSGAAPCGGNCLVTSHNNRIRHNEFSGNGSVANGNNDFGVGLLFGSSGNRVERNGIGGNTNGILIHADAVGNVIRRNIIAGNPPSQVSLSFGASVGFDIRDLSAVADSGARNTIADNLCVTYSGPGPAPCPSTPRIAVDHNTSRHLRKHHDDDEDKDDEDR